MDSGQVIVAENNWGQTNKETHLFYMTMALKNTVNNEFLLTLYKKMDAVKIYGKSALS